MYKHKRAHTDTHKYTHAHAHAHTHTHTYTHTRCIHSQNNFNVFEMSVDTAALNAYSQITLIAGETVTSRPVMYVVRGG